jgi:hypothetical protein
MFSCRACKKIAVFAAHRAFFGKNRVGRRSLYVMMAGVIQGDRMDMLRASSWHKK